MAVDKPPLIRFHVVPREQGEYEKAESMYERITAIREKIQGSDERGLAAVLNNWAGVLQLQVIVDHTTTLSCSPKQCHAHIHSHLWWMRPMLRVSRAFHDDGSIVSTSKFPTFTHVSAVLEKFTR